MSRLSKYCIVLGVCCTEERQSHRFVQMLRGVNDDRTLVVGLCSFFSSFRDDAFIILIEFLHQCSNRSCICCNVSQTFETLPSLMPL